MTIRNQTQPELKAKGPWYVFHNRAGDAPVRIDIMDVIGGWDGISAKSFSAKLKELGEETPLDIHICCDGGSVVEGNEIYNALRSHKGAVNVTIGALCASIATVIAMAGNTVQIADNGLFMIHNPWTFAMGDAEDMRRNADIMDKMKANIIKAYRSREGAPAEDRIAKMMDKESWLTAEEALDLGFVDKIYTPDEEEEDDEVENVLNFDLSKYRNSAGAINHFKALAKSGGNEKPPVLPGNKQTKTAPEKPPVNKQPPNKENQMTEEEIQAEADKRAKALFAAKLKRDKEIDDIVVSVRNRNKQDFGKLASTYKQEDKTPEEFAMAIANAKEGDFDPFIVGSGIEVSGNRIAKGTPGEIFIEAPEYKEIVARMKKGGRSSASCLVQTDGFYNVTTSAGLTSIQKLPGVVELGVRPLMVKDLIAPGVTDATLVRYIREESFTNYAETVAEDATKPPASFVFTEVDSTVKKIAAYTKITDELFKDYGQVASLINMRLPYMVERTEEDQILNGDGMGENLTGLLNTANIQTQAKGANTAMDALYKALTKIRFTGFFEPSGYVMNPVDWEAIRLSKDNNNQYFGGGPFTGAYGNGPVVQFDTLWGKPVVVTPAIAQGTALTGAFRLGAQYFMKDGLTIETTNTDQDDFIKNRITIRAELRLALAVYRPLAFCRITGL